MRRLLYHRSTPFTHYRKSWHTYSFIGLLLISIVALVACGPAATSAPTVPPTQTPTAQLDPTPTAIPTSTPSPTPTDQPAPTLPMVEEPAPVESVAIEVTATDPVSADLVLVTGLPSGCVSFKGYTLEREGDTFQVTATNVRPDKAGLMCTMIYGTETTRIPLTGEIEVCETYPVVVNGESFPVQAKVPGEGCNGSNDAPMLEELAPVESVAMEAEAADPVQANLVVVSGLPNACYSFEGYDVSRDSDTFRVGVTNARPDDPTLACAEMYRTVTTEIPLEGEIEICQTYTVIVNGQSHSVQAIAPNVRCGDPTGNTATDITLNAGETVPVGDEGFQLTFLEVTEDSWCPSDALCIQAGQATKPSRQKWATVS